jgi:superfamily II DNA or RNA helicase
LVDCPVSLRPYQQSAFAGVVREFQERRRRSTLVVHPCGSGKSVTLAFVARWAAETLGGLVLVLAHRDFLLEQVGHKLGLLGLDVVVDKGGQDALEEIQAARSGMWRRDPKVVLGSVQSLHEGRLAKRPRDMYSLIITDECHHSICPTYRRIFDHFSSAKLLGVTATAARLDGGRIVGPGRVYESLAHEYPLPDAIREGWLAPLVQVKCSVEVDLRGLRTTAGDFNQGDLEERISREIEPLVNGAAEKLGDRPAVVFTPDVRSAQAFADGLCVAGVPARATSGDDPDKLAKIRAFEAGDFQAIVNCDLLVEGLDVPRAQSVVLARPTKSLGRLVQMIGRGTRLYPGKESCQIIDFSWLLDKHKDRLVKPVDLVAPALVTDSTRALAHHLVESGCQTDLVKAFDEAEAILKRKAEERKRADRAERERFEREKQERERLRLSVQRRDSGFVWIERNPLGITAGEILRRPRIEELPEHHPRALESQVRQLTQCQVALAEAQRLSPQEAVDMLNQLLARKRSGLASLNQIRCLMRHGYSRDACWSMTVPEASYHIDNLKKGRQAAG